MAGSKHHLSTPIDDAAVRGLHCGDLVFISGRICTARDAAHKYLASPEAQLPAGLQLAGAALYHCGPVVIGADGAWQVTAAGPTTSAREEPYQGEVLRRYGVRAIIGKGGMGDATRRALAECGAVYLSAVGGAAQVLAASVQRVEDVYFLEEFGSPEAMWSLFVHDFPAVVTMDSTGESLHDRVLRQSSAIAEILLR